MIPSLILLGAVAVIAVNWQHFVALADFLRGKPWD